MDLLEAGHSQYRSNMDLLRKMVEKWWSQSKFFRITALVTGSIAGYMSIRYLYIKTKRKLYNLPPGMVGLPIIGHVRIHPLSAQTNEFANMLGGLA